MFYFFLCFCLLSLFGLSFRKAKGIDDEALTADRTVMINGFFVGIIMFSHFNGYVKLDGVLNGIYLRIFKEISQLMVTTFLFYSGYGIFESIKYKNCYIKTFFKKRFLKVYIAFALAIVLFILLNAFLNIQYPLKTILLSFTAWSDIGNSNWFMFATFYLYIVVMISFNLFKKDNYKAFLCIIIGTLLYMILCWKTKSGAWFNTILCFDFGMFVSLFKAEIFKFFKSKWNYILSFIIILLLMYLCHSHGYTFLMYEIYSICFVSLILLVSMKIKIGNKMLHFLGKNTFNIYILQRIPFIALQHVGLSNYNVYIYFIVSILTTIIISIIFNYLLKFIYKVLKI